MADRQFCYLVMAHTDFSGALRTVRRIRALSPRAHVVLRYEDDAALPAQDVRDAGGLPLLSSIRARWGAWTLTEAMLEALRYAVEETAADYVVLVSGQDYPVRDLTSFEREIEQSGVDALLDRKGVNPDDYRYRWYIRTPPLPRAPRIYRAIRHLGWRIGTVTPPVLQMCPNMRDGDYRWWFGLPRRRRDLPDGMVFDKSAQWMTLSAAAVRLVLDVDASRPDVRNFFSHVRIPDEAYVQTIVRHASSLRVVDGATTVAHWVLPTDASPAWLSPEILTTLAASSRAPFARKMPVDPSVDLLAAADTLARHDGVRPPDRDSSRRT